MANLHCVASCTDQPGPGEKATIKRMIPMKTGVLCAKMEETCCVVKSAPKFFTWLVMYPLCSAFQGIISKALSSTIDVWSEKALNVSSGCTRWEDNCLSLLQWVPWTQKPIFRDLMRGREVGKTNYMSSDACDSTAMNFYQSADLYFAFPLVSNHIYF